MDSKIFTVSDLNKIFNVPITTIGNHLRSGIIPSVKSGGRYFIEDKTVTEILHHNSYKTYVNERSKLMKLAKNQ